MDMQKYYNIKLLAVIIFICVCLTACTIQGDRQDANLQEDKNADTNTDTMTLEQEKVSVLDGYVCKIEYEILLGALRDAGVSDLRWDLADSDSDGMDELFISAKTSDANLGHSLLLADSDAGKLWSYAATGAAGNTKWVYISGIAYPVWHDSYETLGTQQSIYSLWSGKEWNSVATLNGGSSPDANGQDVFSGVSDWQGTEISYDEFREKEAQLITNAELSNPDLKNLAIMGDEAQILTELDTYFETREGYVVTLEVDIDANGTEECLYIIKQAANPLLNVMHVENGWGDEKHVKYVDQNITVVVAGKIGEGIRLETIRVNADGNVFTIDENRLVIDDKEYAYNDGEFDKLTDMSALLEMTSQEIEDQIFAAPYSVYYWFTGHAFAGTTSKNEMVSIEGKPYYRILDGAYTKYDDMLTYAENYFSKDILKDFLAKGNVLELGGNLYQVGGEFGGPLVSEYPIEYSIESYTDEQIVYCRCTKYPKDPWTDKTPEEMTDKDYNTFYTYYVMEFIDDRWIFTEWEQDR